MIKKRILLSILSVYATQLNCFNADRTYELISTHGTHDLESGLSRLTFFSAYSSTSTESLPDREDFQSHNTPAIIDQKASPRSKVSWRITKYVAGTLLCAGIGVGSYFLAENLMHEEDNVNDYLYGINQSLTDLSHEIAKLTNLTEIIMGKL